MHFAPSDEQAELVRTVRSLLDRRADPAAVRAAIVSPAGHDEELWQTLAEQIGAPALGIAVEYDGAGATLVETGLVLEQLGHSLAPSPLLASVLVAEVLSDLAATDETAAGLLSRVAAGEVATLASADLTRAAADGAEPVRWQDGSLTGTVPDVLFGAQAPLLLVAATTPDGPGLFAVDVDVPSLVRDRTPAMDPTQQLAALTFDATPATGMTGDVVGALRRAHRAGTVAVACLQLGVAQRGLDMTVAYAKERVQFGRPIGSFQALKHRLADLLVEVEMTRSAAWAAAYAHAHDTADADRLAAAASSYATEALDHVAAETVQMHGGIAITWEHDAHLVFKRAHALRHLFGLPHQRRAVLVGP